MLVSTHLSRALMMSILDSGQGNLISHPCNSPFDLHTAAGNDSEHKVWMWSCPVQHRVFNSSPRTQKKCFKLFCLASAQLLVLSACSLSTWCSFTPQHLGFSDRNPAFLRSSLTGLLLLLPQHFAYLVGMFFPLKLVYISLPSNLSLRQADLSMCHAPLSDVHNSVFPTLQRALEGSTLHST